MEIAVVILHFGSLATTQHSLAELAKKIGDHHVILINNTQGDISELTSIIPGTQLIDNRSNAGFARGVNQGITLALADPQVDAVLLLNNDLTITHGNLVQLGLTFTKIRTAGIVSPILHHTRGYDWGGKYSRWTGMVRHTNWPNIPKTVQSVSHVAGAAMLIKREVIDKIGLFDERFFLYFEDLDFCLRAAAAGFTLHISPDVVAEHTMSSGSHLLRRTFYQWHSHLQFVGKHFSRLTYPTAYLYDLLFYPLVLLKVIFLNPKS